MLLEPARTRTDDICHKFLIETVLDSPRHHSTRSRAAQFDPADIAVVEAWARVVPALESFHLGQFEDGGACIWLLVRDAAAPERPATWLIWPDAERFESRPLDRSRRRVAIAHSGQHCRQLVPSRQDNGAA